MKAFIRKIRSVKKRKVLKKLVGAWIAGMSFRYGQISHKTKPSPFFVNSNQSNQHVERLNPYRRVMIVDDDNQSSTENQSVNKSHGVKLGSGINVILKEVGKKQDQISEPLKSTLTQKSELTYSQDEIDALGLGQVNKEVSLVVGLSMPHSSQSTLAVHEKNWDQLVQESNVPIDMEQKPKILMSRTSADLKNQKWIKEFICSLRSGSTEEFDEELIRCILGKVSELDLDGPSINKILKSVANATLSVLSNDKIMRILAELQKQPPKPDLKVTPSTEVVKIPDKVQAKSSSSIFVKAWVPPLPLHRRQNEVSRITTVLNGQQDNTRTISMYDSSKADLSERSLDHLLTKHGHNLGINDKLPPNPNQKPTKYEQVRTRVNGENRNQFVHEAQALLNDAQFIESFPTIEIRGVKGRGYVYDNPDYPGINNNNDIAGLFFGIHEEGIFAGQIKKIQPISQAQLDILRTEQRID